MSQRERQGGRRGQLLIALTLITVVGLSGCGSPPNANDSEPNPRSWESMMSALVDCLQSDGWVDATYNESTGITVSVPPDQADQYSQDDKACKAKIGFQQVPSSTALSSESLSRLYDKEMETARCLADHGYEPSQAPSRQVFIEQYQARTAEAPWSAYSALPELTQEEFLSISRECPQASTVLGNELWNEYYGGGKG